MYNDLTLNSNFTSTTITYNTVNSIIMRYIQYLQPHRKLIHDLIGYVKLDSAMNIIFLVQ